MALVQKFVLNIFIKSQVNTKTEEVWKQFLRDEIQIL